MTLTKDHLRVFSVSTRDHVVGPSQYLILLLIQGLEGITTPEIKANPAITSANAVYALQQNGLVYSKSLKRKPAQWYLTKVGEAHLENYDDLPKFESWADYLKYKHSPKDEVHIPLPSLINGECTSSNGQHNRLPDTGLCLWCNGEVPV